MGGELTSVWDMTRIGYLLSHPIKVPRSYAGDGDKGRNRRVGRKEEWRERAKAKKSQNRKNA